VFEVARVETSKDRVGRRKSRLTTIEVDSMTDSAEELEEVERREGRGEELTLSWTSFAVFVGLFP